MTMEGRWVLSVLALLGTLAIAGCTQPRPPERDAFISITDEVIGVGYTHISERYIEPVSMGEVAFAGLEGVSRLDPRLRITREYGHIHLIDGDQLVRSFAIPSGDNPNSWADLTAHVIQSGRIVSSALRNAGLERTYEAVFDGALARLDPYSRYLPPSIAREQRALRDGFGGIGITIQAEDGKIRVDSVMEGSPSAKAGIQPGDVILAIGDEPTRELTVGEIARRLRGLIGTSVRITIAHDSETSPRELVLQRVLIVPVTVTYASYDDLAYIRITGFNAQTSTSLERALRRATREMGGKLRGAILDLRENPGGLLDQAESVANLFLTSGRIVSTIGRNPDSNQVSDAAGHDLLHGLPITILVDGNTASAAEVIAVALQDHGRAIVVGSSTYGKGTVQTVHRLPNDGELTITWSRIYAPSGYSLNHLGVIPNVCTSKAKANSSEAAMQVLDMVRSGKLETAAARFTLHSKKHLNKNEIRLLRSSCPPKQDDSQLDIEVAQRLLEDGALFARALEPTGAPELAKSK